MKLNKFLLTLTVPALFISLAHAAPLGTAFTYQGRLASSSNAVTGLYDFSFSLWDAASLGVQQGVTLPVTAVPVTNGYFTVALDFGNNFPGSARWLDISVKTNGAVTYTALTPRQALTPAPYALYSPNAGAAALATSATSAGTASAVTPGAVSSLGIQAGTIMASNVNLASLSNALAPSFWGVNGNVGTSSNNFLGTTDYQELRLRANNTVGLRVQPTGINHPSLIGGEPNNTMDPNARSGIIGGGVGNTVSNATYYAFLGAGQNNYIGKLAPSWYPDNSVLSGGYLNTNAGYAAVVPGGSLNYAYGQYSFASGFRAKAMHTGSFVWADNTDADFASTTNNQFLIRASGGVGINTNNPGGVALNVAGTIQASTLSVNALTVNNSALVTNLNASLLDGLDSTGFWQIGGNSGTGGTGFLGTTDNQPLDLRANNSRGLRLQYTVHNTLSGVSPPYFITSSQTGVNVIGGFDGNYMPNTVIGGTIAGGGYSYWNLIATFSRDYTNEVTGNFGTVGGGHSNTAGVGATVPGGYNNSASGAGSFAAGVNATANAANSFVWSDGTAISSSSTNSFDIHAAGGVHINETDLFLRAGNDRNHGLGYRGSVTGFHTDGPWLFGWDGGALGTVGPETIALKWDFNGSAWVSNNLSCKTLTIRGGADFAEPFSVSGSPVEPGMVMVIDEANPGKLVLSSQAYDTRVAGIISGAGGVQPGIELHQDGLLDQGQKVALSGRVYVHADATSGAIKPGDLLTTSDTPGYAMRVADHAKAQGAILGKAMTGLKEGKGLVLVLVTLQ